MNEQQQLMNENPNFQFPDSGNYPELRSVETIQRRPATNAELMGLVLVLRSRGFQATFQPKS